MQQNRNPAGRGCARPLLIGLGIGAIVILVLVIAALIVLPRLGFSFNPADPAPTDTAALPPPSETAAPTGITPLPTDTPVPPSPTPQPTETPHPTGTPSPTVTPEPTETPTVTPTATDEQLVVTAKSQAFCRYGPGTAFLPNVDIFQGDAMVVNGRYQYGGWIWVRPDTVDRSCWIAASLVDPAVDMNSLPIVDYTQLLPITGDIAPPANVTAVRNGDTVTISWNAINVDPGGARGYLVDVFVCQDGAYLKYITKTENTSIDITDEQNTCAGPSGGTLYGATAIGYTQAVDIPWP